MTDENARHRPEEDAARLGLVVVGEAAALQSGDEGALDASMENIRETIDDMVDEPLTERQEEVVERLASAGGTLTAGLSGALAGQTGRPVDDVLEGAARSIVWQERLSADRDRERAAADEAAGTDPRDAVPEQRRISDDQRQRSGEDTRRDARDADDDRVGAEESDERRPRRDER
jgi:hypothetical protein